MKSKESVTTIKKHGINYIVDKEGKIKKFKPWLGDILSFMYDKIMEKKIFPKLFNADLNKHFEILKKEFGHIHNLKVIEIATGSGTLAEFLPNDNHYIGIDISKGLLKRAYSKFKRYEFKNFELYNVNAETLIFDDNIFDLAVCNLSLNFFNNLDLVIQNLRKILKINSTFFCSVPITERKPKNSKIRGTVYSEKELIEIFSQYGFKFNKKRYSNGAVLYFSVELKNKQ